jgi:hypothetical protein
MASLERITNDEEISSMRILVEAQNLDLGGVWGRVFLAHHRTWDVGKNLGPDMAMREEDFVYARDEPYKGTHSPLLPVLR